MRVVPVMLPCLISLLVVFWPAAQVRGDALKKLMKNGFPLALLAAPLALSFNRQYGGGGDDDEKPYVLPPPPPPPPQIRIITVPQPVPVPVPIHHHHRSIVKHHHHKGKTKIVHVPVKKKHKLIIEEHHDFDKNAFNFGNGFDMKHEPQPLITHGEKIDLGTFGHGFGALNSGHNGASVKLAEGGYHISKGELEPSTLHLGYGRGLDQFHNYAQPLNHGQHDNLQSHASSAVHTHIHAPGNSHRPEPNPRSDGHTDSDRQADLGQAIHRVEHRYQRHSGENSTSRRRIKQHQQIRLVRKEGQRKHVPNNKEKTTRIDSIAAQ